MNRREEQPTKQPTDQPQVTPLFGDDPRVIMAAERTLLAWVRTGLALMGFGFLVARFGLFMQEYSLHKGETTQESPAWSVGIGASLVLLGTVITLAAGWLHGRNLRRISGASLHFRDGFILAIACAVGLGLVGGFMCIRLIWL